MVWTRHGHHLPLELGSVLVVVLLVPVELLLLPWLLMPMLVHELEQSLVFGEEELAEEASARRLSETHFVAVRLALEELAQRIEDHLGGVSPARNVPRPLGHFRGRQSESLGQRLSLGWLASFDQVYLDLAPAKPLPV